MRLRSAAFFVGSSAMRGECAGWATGSSDSAQFPLAEIEHRGVLRRRRLAIMNNAVTQFIPDGIANGFRQRVERNAAVLVGGIRGPGARLQVQDPPVAFAINSTEAPPRGTASSGGRPRHSIATASRQGRDAWWGCWLSTARCRHSQSPFLATGSSNHAERLSSPLIGVKRGVGGMGETRRRPCDDNARTLTGQSGTVCQTRGGGIGLH